MGPLISLIVSGRIVIPTVNGTNSFGLPEGKRGPPKKKLAYLQKYGILIGHIFTGRDSNITSLSNHSSITDKHLLKVYDNGSWKNGIQWVVQGDEGSELFEEKCRGHAQVWSMGQLAVPIFKET